MRKAPGSICTTQTTTLHLAPGHWAGHMRIYHRGCMSLVRAGYRVELMAHTLQGERLNEYVELHSLGEYGSPTLAWRIAGRIKRCQYAYSFARHSKAELFHYYSPEFIPWAKMLRNGTRKPTLFDCMEDFEAYCYQRGGIPDGLRRRLA